MPKVPTYDSKYAITPEASGMLSPGLLDAGNRAVDQGLATYAQAGKSLQDTGIGMVSLGTTLDEHIKAYERHNTLSNLKVQLRTKLADSAAQVATDPNYKDHYTTWNDSAQELKQGHLDQIGEDPLTRQGYDQLWGEYYPHYATAVKSNARKVEIKTFHGDLLARQDDRESEAAQTLGAIINQPGLNPQQVHDAASAKIAELVDTNGADIAGAVKGGVVDYDDGVKMFSRFRDNLQYAYARSVASSNPGVALELLSKGMLKLNDPKQLQQITDAANGHLTRQITRLDMTQRHADAQEAKNLVVTREAVNKDVADLYYKGQLTQDVLDKHKDSRALDDSTYATYSGKIHVDFQKQKDAYREILAKEFSMPPFESKVNPMDPNIAARTAANVQRHYLELVDKGGWDPAEASREAANLGRRINISAITMPEGLGLDEGDRYKPVRIQSKLQEIADRVRGMTPEQRQQALPDLGPKIEILKQLSIANRFWTSQAVDRDQKFQEQVNEVTKQEQAAETSRQQAASMKAQQEQQRLNPSGIK